MDILTDQKKSFFDTFGFLAFPDLLADCIDEIIGEGDTTGNRTTANADRALCHLLTNTNGCARY